jgi:hypothetical protein
VTFMRLGCCAILALAACYAPTIQGGAPCDPTTNSCPIGETCQARGGGSFCTGPGTGVDAGAGGDGSAVGDSCVGGKLLGSVCFSRAPANAAMLAGTMTINTASTNAGNCTEIRPQPGGSSLCLISGATITIATGATVRAIGPNPLVLVAMHTIAVQGTLDASSHAGETVGGGPVVGAGARTAVECNAIGADGTGGSNGNGGGGAAGGSFGGQGGAGGAGKGNTPHGNPGATATPSLLIGGCPGGHGGPGSDGTTGGADGGSGGGAVYLLAGDSIMVSGKISASGAGGGGGTAGGSSSGAGGGGGSGGLIGLESAMLTVTGSMFANGGGGGGGGGDQAVNGGTAGGDSAAAATAATGGGGGTGGGGAGGAGSTTAITGTVGKAGTNPQCAGGGGGGGGGVIRLFGTPATTGAMISPAAT